MIFPMATIFICSLFDTHGKIHALSNGHGVKRTAFGESHFVKIPKKYEDYHKHESEKM